MAKKKSKKQAVNNAPAENKGAGFSLKKVFTDSCICYTIIVLLLVTVDTILSSEGSERVIFGSDFLGLYPFALLVGCANMIFSNKKLKMWLRVALHAVCVLGGFAIYMATVKQLEFNSIAYISIALIVVYAFIMAAALVIIGLKAKSERENVEYKTVYNINSPSDTKNNTKTKTRNNNLADIEKDAMEELSENESSNDSDKKEN